MPFLLLPDGRLRSRRWRLVVAAAVVGMAMFVVGGILFPGQTSNDPGAIDNPFGLAGVAGRIAMVVTINGLVLYAVSLPAALGCVVLRFRASRGVERQQLLGSPPAPPSRCWCCCRCPEASGSHRS
jgi:hypothetical protein